MICLPDKNLSISETLAFSMNKEYIYFFISIKPPDRSTNFAFNIYPECRVFLHRLQGNLALRLAAWHEVNEGKYMIIITDAHVSAIMGNHADFFQMLTELEKNDEDLIFLGDIFDLWISLPAYEKDIHKRFLDWCRIQKKRRIIGFIEGNHEFFLAKERSDAFSWCTDAPCHEDNRRNLFCHGDMINQKDTGYLLFKKMSKNRIINALLRIFPKGPEFCEILKKYLKKTNSEFRKYLPEEDIKVFAEKGFAKGYKNIFSGHFHQEYIYKNSENQNFYILPDWFSSRKVTFYNEFSGKIFSVST